jgi:hypothetical protein
MRTVNNNQLNDPNNDDNDDDSLEVKILRIIFLRTVRPSSRTAKIFYATLFAVLSIVLMFVIYKCIQHS